MRKIGTARQFIVLLLLVAFLLPGFPRFAPEDVSRDNEVDLRDNILLVQAFTDAAQTDVHLEGDLRKLLSSLYLTAGLKTVIKAEVPAKLTSTISVDFPCLLIGEFCLADYLPQSFLSISKEKIHSSFLMAPDARPPRMSLFI